VLCLHKVTTNEVEDNGEQGELVQNFDHRRGPFRFKIMLGLYHY
jgi:hypothetical protein